MEDARTAIRIVPAAETTCKRGIMPEDKVAYYNRIDIGIFLLFLEVCLGYNGITFSRDLLEDNGDDSCDILRIIGIVTFICRRSMRKIMYMYVPRYPDIIIY